MNHTWAAVITLFVAATAALGVVEYRGLTDGRPGTGTISNWTYAQAQRHGWAGWALVWVALLATAAVLAWHFTFGRGTRWPWTRLH